MTQSPAQRRSYPFSLPGTPGTDPREATNGVPIARTRHASPPASWPECLTDVLDRIRRTRIGHAVIRHLRRRTTMYLHDGRPGALPDPYPLDDSAGGPLRPGPQHFIRARTVGCEAVSGNRLGAMVALVGAVVGLAASCGGSASRSDEPAGLGRWEGPPPAPRPAPPRCRWFNTRWAVHYRPGSAAIEPDFQREPTGDPLMRVVEDYRSGAFERVRVVGFIEHYCPSAPSDEELARERGLRVIERLVELGVSRDAIETTPVTIVACCIDVDDACDPDVPHALRIVEINYWRCEE